MFILSCTTGFYTGRAGPAWIGSDAFAFSSRSDADRKAALFNGRSILTGVTFTVERA